MSELEPALVAAIRDARDDDDGARAAALAPPTAQDLSIDTDDADTRARERAHGERRFPAPAGGMPWQLRYARRTDELRHRVDESAERLPFAPPAPGP